MEKIYRRLPELRKIHEITRNRDDLLRTRILGEVNYGDEVYPLISFEIGSEDKSLPTLGLFGGVHGLEKIGTQVIIAFLNSNLQQLKWDKDFRKLFETCRIVSIPLINPAGMAHNYRSNGNGVDLMRNAPIESEEVNTPLLVSGHRLSNKIPWFRGTPEKQMEMESQILCNYVEEEVFPSQTAITIDFHSGFGMRDRFWYPFAKSKKPFPRIKEVQNIKRLLDKTFPHHIYKVEPQSKNYVTHGDLWDYLFEKHEALENNSLFLPWTLEMGSWIWLKKNPAQIFRMDGLFNPIKEHRRERTMRRHLLLIQFLLRMTRNPESWIIKKNSIGS